MKALIPLMLLTMACSSSSTSSTSSTASASATCSAMLEASAKLDEAQAPCMPDGGQGTTPIVLPGQLAQCASGLSKCTPPDLEQLKKGATCIETLPACDPQNRMAFTNAANGCMVAFLSLSPACNPSSGHQGCSITMRGGVTGSGSCGSHASYDADTGATLVTFQSEPIGGAGAFSYTAQIAAAPTVKTYEPSALTEGYATVKVGDVQYEARPGSGFNALTLDKVIVETQVEQTTQYLIVGETSLTLQPVSAAADPVTVTLTF